MPTEDLPEDLMIALAADRAAGTVFARLPESHRREYLKWIGEAKRPETRARRIAGTLDKLRQAPKRHDGEA